MLAAEDDDCEYYMDNEGVIRQKIKNNAAGVNKKVSSNKKGAFTYKKRKRRKLLRRIVFAVLIAVGVIMLALYGIDIDFGLIGRLF